VPTFADRGCRVVSATDHHGRQLQNVTNALISLQRNEKETSRHVIAEGNKCFNLCTTFDYVIHLVEDSETAISFK
jgi:hypothetical protein